LVLFGVQNRTLHPLRSHLPAFQVVEVSAHTGKGIPELLRVLSDFREAMTTSGELARRRAGQRERAVIVALEEVVSSCHHVTNVVSSGGDHRITGGRVMVSRMLCHRAVIVALEEVLAQQLRSCSRVPGGHASVCVQPYLSVYVQRHLYVCASVRRPALFVCLCCLWGLSTQGTAGSCAVTGAAVGLNPKP
jgi:Methylmalonyl Co-A mutase-associated GTPase MeaB